MINFSGKWRQVFLFTLSRYFKGKAIKVFIAVLIVLPVIFVVALSLIMGKDKVSDIKNLYIIDEAETQINYSYFASVNSMYKNVNIKIIDEKDLEVFKKENSFLDKDILCDITFNDKTLKYEINIYISDEASLNLMERSDFTKTFLKFFNTSRMEKIQIDKDIINITNSEINVSTVMSSSSSHSAQNLPLDLLMVNILSIPIILCILLVCVPVFNTAVQEKTNRIIEFMIISVSAMQMMIGKVLAAVSYIIILIAIAVTSFLIALLGFNLFMDDNPIKEWLSEIGMLDYLSCLGIGQIIYLLISFTITLLFYAFLAAFLGALCSRSEDASKANMPFSILVISGYYLAIIAASSEGVIRIFARYFPFSSSFYASVEMLKGNLSLTGAIISLLIQMVSVCILVLIVAKVYKNVILHNGERVQLKKLKNFWGE